MVSERACRTCNMRKENLCVARSAKGRLLSVEALMLHSAPIWCPLRISNKAHGPLIDRDRALAAPLVPADASQDYIAGYEAYRMYIRLLEIIGPAERGFKD